MTEFEIIIVLGGVALAIAVLVVATGGLYSGPGTQRDDDDDDDDYPSDDDDDDDADWPAEKDRARDFAVSIGCTIARDGDVITCHTYEQWDALLAFRLREGL